MLPIAVNTLKEFLRNKILYIIIGLAVLLILFSIILVQLTITQTEKVFIDSALTVIEVFALITTLFLGSYLLYNEIQKNTILFILSKNSSRANFIIGKFFGFSILIFIIYLIFSIAFIIAGVVLKYKMGVQIDLLNKNYYLAIYLSFLKILVLLAFVIFFSTFVSPFTVLLVSISIYFISHSLSFVKFYLLATKKISPDSVGYKVIEFFYYIFPNFQDLSFKEYLLSPFLGDYNWIHIVVSSLSSLGYIFVLLLLSILIFNCREF